MPQQHSQISHPQLQNPSLLSHHQNSSQILQNPLPRLPNISKEGQESAQSQQMLVKGGHLGEPSEQKMRKINQRRGKYKRSTNNSHKKFINVAKKLFLEKLTLQDQTDFEKQFRSHSNSRAYFFIILSNAKLKFGENEIEEFIQQFCENMEEKMNYYEKELKLTTNQNFVNFRKQEIIDLQYACISLKLYFQGRIQQSVEAMYKKDKNTVYKKEQYLQARNVVMEIEKRLHPKSVFSRVEEPNHLKQENNQLEQNKIEFEEPRQVQLNQQICKNFFALQSQAESNNFGAVVSNHQYLNNFFCMPNMQLLNQSYPYQNQFFSSIYNYNVNDYSNYCYNSNNLSYSQFMLQQNTLMPNMLIPSNMPQNIPFQFTQQYFQNQIPPEQYKKISSIKKTAEESECEDQEIDEVKDKVDQSYQ